MSDEFTVGITGAAGYIGSRLLVELEATHPDWNVVAVDNFYRGDVREAGGVTVQHCDVRNTDRLTELFEGVDAIVHLAAISGLDDCADNPELTHAVNVQATTDLAWYCNRTGTALVFPASMAIFGHPDEFPITVDQPREPINWYGRSKVLGERAIETFAHEAFPAHVLVKSNLYGGHTVDDEYISKGTVINFFVGRALDEEPITVYEPGTQSRNFVHVVDVARAYVASLERLQEQLAAGDTGVTTYPIASDEDPSVHAIAEEVQEIAQAHDLDTAVELVENPRSGETMVEAFTVDTTKTHEELGWEAQRGVAAAIERRIDAQVTTSRATDRSRTPTSE
jgi:nucleoside-diphosphate-sugar epimerase